MTVEPNRRAKHPQADVDRADVVYDKLAEVSPQGLTFGQLQALTKEDNDPDYPEGFSRKQLSKSLQVLRDIFAYDKDKITIISEIPERRGKWIHRLVNGKGVQSEEGLKYLGNRFNDVERRILTNKNVVVACANDLDGRTKAGQRAAIWALHLGRAEEEIQMLGLQDEGGSTNGQSGSSR